MDDFEDATIKRLIRCIDGLIYDLKHDNFWYKRKQMTEQLSYAEGLKRFVQRVLWCINFSFTN